MVAPNKVAVVKKETAIDRFLKKYWEEHCGNVKYRNAYGEYEERERSVAEVENVVHKLVHELLIKGEEDPRKKNSVHLQ